MSNKLKSILIYNIGEFVMYLVLRYYGKRLANVARADDLLQNDAFLELESMITRTEKLLNKMEQTKKAGQPANKAKAKKIQAFLNKCKQAQGMFALYAEASAKMAEKPAEHKRIQDYDQSLLEVTEELKSAFEDIEALANR